MKQFIVYAQWRANYMIQDEKLTAGEIFEVTAKTEDDAGELMIAHLLNNYIKSANQIESIHVTAYNTLSSVELREQ